nr:putative ribonuclease H-like domain-containing protein [Tanacetum cinerariifolium]
MANFTTEAEYIAASSCCGQVLWLQNQLLYYGYNFMQIKIHVDNESAIYVVKNPVYHSNTKHIKIMHHFIRDSYEKRLIEMVKIHTDFNVADLLNKAFYVTRFNFWLQVLVYLILRAWIKGRLDVYRRTQKDIKLPQTSVPIKLGADEAVNQEEGDRVKRAITTNASLEAVQDSGRPRRQETMRGTSAPTRSERVLEQPNEPPLTEGHTSGNREGKLEENFKLMDTVPTPHDSPLTGGYTPGSDDGRITLAELMETYTILSNMVTQLETELSSTKAIYNKAFITLTNRVKKLESQLKQKRSKAVIHSLDKEGPSLHIEDFPKHGRIIEEMNKDENINLSVNKEKFRRLMSTQEVMMLNIKRSSAKDKGKGIMQETELPKNLKKKEMIQLSLDEELAQKLYVEELAKEEARQE